MKTIILSLLGAATIGASFASVVPAVQAGDIRPSFSIKFGSDHADSGAELRLVRPGHGRYRHVSDDRLGIFGYITHRGVQLVDILNDSPADSLGLETGDVILAVNGYSVYSANDWYRAISLHRRFAELQVRDMRTGRIVYRTARLLRY
jgi:S1-C subfamily serine protease